jgi:hypothetical protein
VISYLVFFAAPVAHLPRNTNVSDADGKILKHMRVIQKNRQTKSIDSSDLIVALNSLDFFSLSPHDEMPYKESS